MNNPEYTDSKMSCDDCVSAGTEVSRLAVAGGGFSSDIAGEAYLAVAEVASSADIAGVASRPTLLGWRSRPLLEWRPRTTLLGWHPRPTLLEWRSRPLLGLCPRPLLGRRSRPLLGRRLRLVVADFSSMCSSQCDNDWLVPGGDVKDSDDVVFPGSSELGDPTVVIPPVVGIDPSVANNCSRGRDLNCVRAPAGVDVFPADQELLGENNEAIVVGAVGTGALWFLTGWAEGTELEFMIDTGCQVTILATSVLERMCALDSRVWSRLRGLMVSRRYSYINSGRLSGRPLIPRAH